ncbi:MAG: molybdopterin cofactor-binding domain-containing protein, partial [Gammaproteobacteria bacterium]
GQALMERTAYSEDGQLLSGSYSDYALPRASDVPSFHFASHAMWSAWLCWTIAAAAQAAATRAQPGASRGRDERESPRAAEPGALAPAPAFAAEFSAPAAPPSRS